MNVTSRPLISKGTSFQRPSASIGACILSDTVSIIVRFLSYEEVVLAARVSKQFKAAFDSNLSWRIIARQFDFSIQNNSENSKQEFIKKLYMLTCGNFIETVGIVIKQDPQKTLPKQPHTQDDIKNRFWEVLLNHARNCLNSDVNRRRLPLLRNEWQKIEHEKEFSAKKALLTQSLRFASELAPMSLHFIKVRMRIKIDINMQLTGEYVKMSILLIKGSRNINELSRLHLHIYSLILSCFNFPPYLRETYQRRILNAYLDNTSYYSEHVHDFFSWLWCLQVYTPGLAKEGLLAILNRSLDDSLYTHYHQYPELMQKHQENAVKIFVLTGKNKDVLQVFFEKFELWNRKKALGIIEDVEEHTQKWSQMKRGLDLIFGKLLPEIDADCSQNPRELYEFLNWSLERSRPGSEKPSFFANKHNNDILSILFYLGTNSCEVSQKLESSNEFSDGFKKKFSVALTRLKDIALYQAEIEENIKAAKRVIGMKHVYSTATTSCITLIALICLSVLACFWRMNSYTKT